MKQLTVTEALEHSGMKNVKHDKIDWFCEYKGNKITISRTCGNYDWDTYSLTINGVKIATRCKFYTLIRKIKTYK